MKIIAKDSKDRISREVMIANTRDSFRDIYNVFETVISIAHE